MDWQEVLKVPLFTAAALALIPLLIPSFRWNRELARDIQLWKDMPPGNERDLLGGWIEEQATRVREYRELIPLYDKALGWGLVVVIGWLAVQIGTHGIGGIGMDLLISPKLPVWFQAIGVALLIAGPGLLTAITLVSMPRGRSMMGLTPQQHRAYMAGERAAYSGDAARVEAFKRLKRIHRAEKKASREHRRARLRARWDEFWAGKRRARR